MAKKVIMAIIIIATVLVTGVFIALLVFNPEYLVKKKIKNLASEYYNNYYIQVSEEAKAETAKVLEKYKESGLAPVSLRTLMMSGNQKADEQILEYCDGSKMTVVFFPEAPYDKESYRVEYNYSCNF